MSRLWLLVEWIEEKNIFSSYGVVSVGSLVGSDTNLHVKKIIFVRDKHGNSAKRAEILRISDNKQYIKEQKALLEKDDHNVKNVLSICMKTLMEMKSNSSKYQDQSSSGQHSPASNQSLSNLPVVVAEPDHSSSDESEPETNHIRNGRKRARQPERMKTYKNKRIESLTSSSSRRSTPSPNQNVKINQRHSTSCSTPIIPKPKIFYDQGTQTEPMKDLKRIEALVHTLYQQFNSLVDRMQVKEEENIKLLQQNDTNQSNQINHYIIDQSLNQMEQYKSPSFNQINQYTDGQNNQIDQYEFNGTVVTQVAMNGAYDQNANDYIPIYAEVPEEKTVEVAKDVKNNMELPTPFKQEVEVSVEKNVTRVKRVEAHTTGDDLYDKMVPIGRGFAKVPGRLLNDIDWTSYTGATRQLMQAIFPRKVLATHCLTGKQSPAFADKPPKKQLDPNIVNDIIDTVYEKCGNVSKRQVRASISTKCTDEAKLYRNRCNQNLDKKSKKADQENLPPSAAASPYSDCSV